MAEDRKTVTVFCRIANGVELRLFKPGYDDGTGSGYRPIVGTGPKVLLKGPSGLAAGTADHAGVHAEPVANEIDAAWWAEWQEQNKGHNPLFDRGFVYEEKAEEEAAQ